MTRLRSISRYISALTISLALTLNAMAQTQEEASRKGKWLTGVEVSADVVGPAMLAFGSYGQYEAALRLNLRGKYFPVVEVGIGKSDHEDDGTQLHYTTSAPYFKAGCDFNILRNKNDIYRVYFGLRYAFTSFEYDLEHPGIEDPVWGGVSEYSVLGSECSYHWAEMLFGVQAKISGPVHLGWSLRYRSRLSADEGVIEKAWYVPGFGKSKRTNFGGTFNIIVVI